MVLCVDDVFLVLHILTDLGGACLSCLLVPSLLSYLFCSAVCLSVLYSSSILLHCTSAMLLCRGRSGVCVKGWAGVPRQDLELATASHKTLISQQLYHRVSHGLPITLVLASALGVEAGAVRLWYFLCGSVACSRQACSSPSVQHHNSFSFSFWP